MPSAFEDSGFHAARSAGSFTACDLFEALQTVVSHVGDHTAGRNHPRSEGVLTSGGETDLPRLPVDGGEKVWRSVGRDLSGVICRVLKESRVRRWAIVPAAACKASQSVRLLA